MVRLGEQDSEPVSEPTNEPSKKGRFNMKPPTKAIFKTLLEREIDSWTEKASTLEGTMKEQAIGRLEERRWLLAVFEGKEIRD